MYLVLCFLGLLQMFLFFRGLEITGEFEYPDDGVNHSPQYFQFLSRTNEMKSLVAACAKALLDTFEMLRLGQKSTILPKASDALQVEWG